MYTVKHAAALTGLSADTLRMWERRYGVVAPVRSESGYRLYDDDAITRLTAMAALVEAGWSPRLAAAQVASGTTVGPPTASVATAAPDDAGDLLIRWGRGFDPADLARSLDEVLAGAEWEDLVDGWLMPALVGLGDGWCRGEVSVAGEHFVSAGIHRRLSAALDAAPRNSAGPRVLVGLARGARHELGVLAFSVLLARAGVNVVYLGSDVPPDSWVVAAIARDPAAVVLGVPTLDDVAGVRDTVAALRAARPDLSVLLGGGAQDLVGSGELLGHTLLTAARGVADRLAP